MAVENVAVEYINDLFVRVNEEIGQNENRGNERPDVSKIIPVEAAPAEISAFEEVPEPAAAPASVAV